MFYLKCIGCSREYKESKVHYTCPYCGQDKGLLEVLYDYKKIARNYNKENLNKCKNFDITRYDFILPVSSYRELPPLKIGGTPLYRSRRINEILGLEYLYFKDDTSNPSASFKDRASALALARMKRLNKDVIACASTGNAASSLACLSASVGAKCIIFVPRAAPKAKLAQLLAYGANVFSIKANYDDVFDFCMSACDHFNWYNRNTGINPYMLEGKKTAALEIAEQLQFKSPDKIIVSAGDGCIYSSIYKGFYDLKNLGWVKKIPRIIGVQAEGAAALVKARSSGKITPIPAKTIADSISVGYPRAGYMALKARKKSKGEFIKVTDKEILSSIHFLAKYTGIFAEPAAAAAFAGLKKMLSEKKIKKNEKIVVLITGSGLKDTEAVFRLGLKPNYIGLNLKELERKLS